MMYYPFRFHMRWILFLALTATITFTKKFEKCELANELLKEFDVPYNKVKEWVCIAEYESNFDTNGIKMLKDGRKAYGIFNINSTYCCKENDKKFDFPNVCGMLCSNFRDKNLTDDIACAKKIINHTEKWKGNGTGFTAWDRYENDCMDTNLDSLWSECDKEPMCKKPTSNAEPHSITVQVFLIVIVLILCVLLGVRGNWTYCKNLLPNRTGHSSPVCETRSRHSVLFTPGSPE